MLSVLQESTRSWVTGCDWHVSMKRLCLRMSAWLCSHYRSAVKPEVGYDLFYALKLPPPDPSSPAYYHSSQSIVHLHVGVDRPF